MKLNSSDLALLRTRSHNTVLHLSIFQPRTVMACKVNNASIARDAITIAYDTVTSGSYLDVKAGMTLLIGTATGLSDVGRIRIRSVTSAQFVVAENSHIDWKDNLYLTVLRYWEVWPIYPRIIINPADPLDVIFYKDYDIAYVTGTSGQNTVLGTFVCAGPHRAAFIDDGEALLWYTSSGTYNLRGDTLAYDWDFEGGDPTGSLVANPGYVSYDTPGHYVTSLMVSGSGGSIDTTYRYVSIYDRPENGTNVPILKWEISRFNGSRAEGGYTADIIIHQPISNLFDDAVVVIFADDQYGNIKTSLGGNAEKCSKIVFAGYILGGSIQYNYKDSLVKFSVGNISEMMKQAEGFGISVENTYLPNKWYELKSMDCRRAIYHYLKWHSTVLSLADFRFVGTDQYIQYFDSDRESIFDAVDNLMRSTLVGEIVSDRQGSLWAEVSIAATPNATGTFVPVMALDNRDWMDDLLIDEQVIEPTSYLEYGGISYTPPTGTSSASLILYTTSLDCYGASTGGFDAGGTFLIMGAGNLSTRKSWVPFTVNLPKNQNITSATLKVIASANDSNVTCKVKIGCEAADNPSAPTNWATLDARVLTTAYTTDNNVAAWTAGNEYNFDVTSAVQEILNRAGWLSGYTLAILFHDNGSSNNAYRHFASTENVTYNEAKLEIAYQNIGVSIPLMASAPGIAPGYRGISEQKQGLALSSQAQLNQLVGDVYANKNAKYNPINTNLTGNYRNLDIAPQEAVAVDIKAGDTNRGVAIKAPYFPTDIVWEYNARKSLFLPRVLLSRITCGLIGETITMP